MNIEIEKNITPHQLQQNSFGFVKLKQRTKKPFEKNWQSKPYSHSDIQKYIAQDDNYALLGGYGETL